MREKSIAKILFNESQKSHSLKLDYADFISNFIWDDYITVTFRQVHRDSIQWSERLWQTLDKFGATRAFIAAEPHKLDGIHLHSLARWGLSESPSTAHLWKYLFKAYGRNQVEPVGDVIQVCRYCAKYVVKENDFFFKGSPKAWIHEDWMKDEKRLMGVAFV